MKIGQTISHYRILTKLGEGGMGVVYKAEDTKLHRSVALKFLPPELTRDEEAKTRFIREARAASALDHPNIAVVHEFDETSEGHSFICMAFYDGETLKEKIKRGTMDLQESIRLAVQIANGLERAHEAGIVHRDIKPANIMVTSRGEVKIVDFGLAKLSGASIQSRTGHTAGTAAYMSPEQVRGEKADHRSDLFSLGVLLYEMVSGSRPFTADHDAALFYAITNLDPTPPSTLRKDLPSELEQIILRLLQKDPKDRYQHSSEVRRDLNALLGVEETVREKYSLRRWLLSRRLSIPLGLGVGLTLILLSLFTAKIQSWLGWEPVPVEKHIAVLPFQNIGGDSTNQVFCDGLLETLTGKITQLENFPGALWVVPASEIRRRKVVSANEAYEVLGASLAVDGSIQRSPDQVHLILNLIDARSSRQLRSVQVSERLENLFSLQNQAVRSMLKMLELEFNPQVYHDLAAGGTMDPQAFEYYLQARGYLQKGDHGLSRVMAIQLLEQALQLDTTYIDAYAALASAYEKDGDANKGEQTLQKAIRAKPKDWLAYNNLGVFYWRHGRLDDAIVQFEDVLSLAPENVRGFNNLGGIYLYQQRWKDAEAMFEQSLRVMPNYVAYSGLGHGWFYDAGRYVDAAKMYAKALEMNNRDYRIWGSLGAAYYWTPGGREKSKEAYEEAIRIAEVERKKDPQNASLLSHLADFYAMTGDSTRALPLLEEALSLSSVDHDVMERAGEVYEQLGKREKAIEWIRAAVREGSPPAMLEKNPALESLLVDPRMASVRKKN